ncbi:TetR family transcriptional regulator [Micromonospora echinofusca]|uniref:TetR family transcriptional regulator n=1 Tax=Micromonospora echinofusca TaxID=47858 RepID=A0ABS3VQ49_MICEH|nr:TetR family transcriptional regulator [Micromonospora echinofusca]
MEPDRPALIVRAARELAEAEGWEAVTTRRLAERAGCGQSDLYRHFTDREAVVAAVAVDGYAQLAATLRAARSSTDDPQHRWTAVVAAYLDFANGNPALYDAMFVLTPDLSFADPDGPAPLEAAFAELRRTLTPLAVGADLDAFTEVGWSTLHGMVMLTRGGRLRPDLQERREAVVVAHLRGGCPVPRQPEPTAPAPD